MNRLLVKICGLSTPESVDCAIDAGADMIGFVFHPKSPRNVSVEQAASLAERARGRVKTVALVVDADDARLAEIAQAMRPDLWQFHGSETVQRIQKVRTRYGIPIIKALGWSESGETCDDVLNYEQHADLLLLDAKPPKDAAYPGGHGRAFDWATLGLLAQKADKPVEFMLSGGLSPENVSDAITSLRAMRVRLTGVDVSSGVESAPGVKDLGKIRAFIAAARAAEAS